MDAAKTSVAAKSGGTTRGPSAKEMTEAFVKEGE